MYIAIAVREQHLLPGSFAISRHARSVLKRLLEQGLLVSNAPKGAVRLGFPVEAAEQWLPQLWADPGV